MSPLKQVRLVRWWAAWVDLVTTRESGTTLALFRIALSLVVLQTLVSTACYGLVDVLWVGAAHGGAAVLHPNWLVRLLGGPTPFTAWTLFAVASASACLLAIGVAVRATSFVLLLSYLALTDLNPDASGGYDAMITNALWILVFARSAATLSVSCRLRTGNWFSESPVPAWPRYVLIFQLVVVYTITGLRKTGELWTALGDFNALYYILFDPHFTHFDGEAFAGFAWVAQIATAVTWLWEVLAPVLLLVLYARYTRDRAGRWRHILCHYDLRVPWAAVGIALHIGIFALLAVTPFSWIALAFYIALWRPGEWEHLLAGGRLTRRVGRLLSDSQNLPLPSDPPMGR